MIYDEVDNDRISHSRRESRDPSTEEENEISCQRLAKVIKLRFILDFGDEENGNACSNIQLWNRSSDVTANHSFIHIVPFLHQTQVVIYYLHITYLT